MFGDWAINVINSKVKIKLDNNDVGDEKNLKFANKRKSETLTIDDVMLNGKTKDFSKTYWG